MIPPFDPSTGNLPPGIHPATWQEFVACFGHTPHRLALIAGLKNALDALKRAGCQRVYIDGSFVTDKENVLLQPPADFDACWEIAGVDSALLLQIAPSLLLDRQPPRAVQKAAYHGEFFPISSAVPGGTSMLTFFQQDRQGNPKGIVVIDLGGLP